MEEDTWYKEDKDKDFFDNDNDDSFSSRRTDRTFNPQDFAITQGSRKTIATPNKWYWSCHRSHW